jgi:hypothetical protein
MGTCSIPLTSGIDWSDLSLLLTLFLSGFMPFPALLPPLVCPFQTSVHGTCTLGFVLTTSASPATLAIPVLALLSIGLVVITLDLSYLPSPNPFLSYLVLLSYRSFLLFMVWTMVAPTTPSHSVLVSSFPCLTQVNMVRALVCSPTI